MLATNRRTFLAIAAASLLGAARGDSKPAPARKIIDPHQHLWDRDRLKLAWIMKGSVLDRNYLLSDYQEASKGLGILSTLR